MEIDRPFRIRKPSHNVPEKANEASVTAQPANSIQEQFRADFNVLTKQANFASTQDLSPGHLEKHCAEFQTTWEGKLQDAKLDRFTGDMVQAVDAIRSVDDLNLNFVDEMNAPQFKLNPDVVRRLAKGRMRDDL